MRLETTIPVKIFTNQ